MVVLRSKGRVDVCVCGRVGLAASVRSPRRRLSRSIDAVQAERGPAALDQLDSCLLSRRCFPSWRGVSTKTEERQDGDDDDHCADDVDESVHERSLRVCCRSESIWTARTAHVSRSLSLSISARTLCTTAHIASSLPDASVVRRVCGAVRTSPGDGHRIRTGYQPARSCRH
jgi:hypothetical protein